MPANRHFGAVAELAATQHGVITRSQAAHLGIGRSVIGRLVRDGHLLRPAPGVLALAGVPETWERRLTIATLANAGAAVSHRAAGELHGLDGVVGQALEVTVERNRTLRLPGLTVHRTLRWDAEDLTVLRGIRCTSLARTLCDLGAVVADDRVEQALDDALRRGASRRWVDERREALRRPGPSGTGSIDRVAESPDRAGALPDSWFERVLVRSIVRAGLPRPVLQHVVRLPDGRTVRLDAAYPDRLIGIEADGDATHGTRSARRSDRRRENQLRALGWELVHAGWEDRHGSDAFIGALRTLVEHRSDARSA